MRRCLLLILLASFFGQNQCELTQYERKRREKRFFVSRQDTKEAICIHSDHFMVPTFNLDELKFPGGVGIVDWSWHSEWQWDQSHSLYQYNGIPQKFIAADRQFQYMMDAGSSAAGIFIQASSISLWLTFKNTSESSGFLFELDHWNKTTRVKDTTMKYCDQRPEETKAPKCTFLDYKNGTNFLNDGNDWVLFVMLLKFNADKKLESLEMEKLKSGKLEFIGHWNTTIKPLNILKSEENVYLFSKSEKRNAAFMGYRDSVYGKYYLRNVEMKRNHTQRKRGKLCVRVVWEDDGSSNGSSQEMQMKNLLTRRVTNATNLIDNGTISRFEFDQLDVGKYKMRLKFSERRQPRSIELCPGDNILKTWRRLPKAITKCQFEVGFKNEFTAWPSSTIKPQLKPNWSLDEWAYVCDRLGIGSNDTAVRIKLCNFHGCNFSKCPHLQDDSPYLFNNDTE